MKCIMCDSERFIVRRKLHDKNIVECHRCHLQMFEPMPSVREQAHIHDRYLNEVWTRELTNADFAVMKSCTFRDYLRILRPFVDHGKLLDIGCATGEFMQEARMCGFDVYGVESSPRSAEICENTFGHERIVKRTLQQDDFPPGYFSLITLFDTIEHVFSPHALIKDIHHVLRDDGYLVFVTPDTSSLSARIGGGHWLHYKPEHIYYYNRHNIQRLLAPLFKIKKITCAVKTVSLGYVGATIRFNTTSIFKKIVGSILTRLPFGLKNVNVRVSFGEMLVIAQKQA